jgi:hypothetical protein
MPVCVAVAGATVALLATEVFALVWTHSVEKTEWHEEWRIADGLLTLDSATVSGSGAGMDPPAGAIRDGDGWRYIPQAPPLRTLLLAASPYGGDYRLCWTEGCRRLAELLPPDTVGPVELSACRR